MSYIIDTCILSEFIKKKPNANVKNWYNQQPEIDLYLSAVTIAEIKKGIYKIEPIQPERALKLLGWLNTIEINFSQQILPIDDKVLEQWSKFSASMERQGKTLAVMDSLIGATSFLHNLTLVTRNVTDFNALPLKILNPFERL